MTSWKLLQSLLPDTMEVESTKNQRVKKKGIEYESKTQITKCVKLPISMNTKTKEYCRLCFEAFDFYYNSAVTKINELYENQKTIFTNWPTCIYDGCTFSKEDNSYFCSSHKNEKPKWNLNITTIKLRKELPISNTDLESQKDTTLHRFIKVPYDLRNDAIEYI
jgi:hypothetical protein